MTIQELETALVAKTGEPLATLRQRGFHELTRQRPVASLDLWLDCPFCGRPVLVAGDDQDPLPDQAECGQCETTFEFDRHELYAAPLEDIYLAIQADRVTK